MLSFIHEPAPTRVVFRAGALATLPEEIERLGLQKALVLSTPEQAHMAEHAASLLGQRAAGVFAKAVMHVPIETAHAARQEAQRLNADCAVAIGGGSTTGLGKAIALESALPIIAIPTTYAGSEMTPIWGITTRVRPSMPAAGPRPVAPPASRPPCPLASERWRRSRR